MGRGARAGEQPRSHNPSWGHYAPAGPFVLPPQPHSLRAHGSSWASPAPVTLSASVQPKDTGGHLGKGTPSPSLPSSLLQPSFPAPGPCSTAARCGRTPEGPGPPHPAAAPRHHYRLQTDASSHVPRTASSASSRPAAERGSRAAAAMEGSGLNRPPLPPPPLEPAPRHPLLGGLRSAARRNPTIGSQPHPFPQHPMKEGRLNRPAQEAAVVPHGRPGAVVLGNAQR